MIGYLQTFIFFSFAFLLNQCFGFPVKWFSRNSESSFAKKSLRSSICPIIYEHSVEHTSTVEPRIVNGDPASTKVSPALVAFYKHGDLAACTGTLVSKRWIVTAAHCGFNASSGHVAAVLMKNSYMGDPTNDNGLLLSIRKTYIHDKYIPEDPIGQQYDVAAIELTTDAPEGTSSMRLNVNAMIPEVHSYLRVIGFGRQSLWSIDISRPLSQVDLPVVPYEQCASLYENVTVLEISDHAHVCAGYVGRGGCDSCQGDSGGPVIQYDESGNPVLVAIVTAGIGCAQPFFPGVNNRVSFYHDWFKSIGMEFEASSSVAPKYFSETSVRLQEKVGM